MNKQQLTNLLVTNKTDVDWKFNENGEILSPQGEPLSEEQLLAIWKEYEDKMNKRQFLKNQFSSDVNLKFSDFCFANRDKEPELNWDEEILLEIKKDNPNWDKIKLFLGDEKEDLEQISFMKKMHEEDREDLIRLHEEFLDENIMQEASFMQKMIRVSQEQQELIDAETFKEQIRNGEDLEYTESGRTDESGKIENYYDASVINQAKNDVKSFNSAYEVDQIYTMERGDALGVAETDLTRKLVKKEMIKMVDQMQSNGYITKDQASQIMNYYWGVESQGKLLAFRLNPSEIERRISDLMSEVRNSITGEEENLDQIEKDTITLAVGSVIAHEAQHALEMTMEKSNTSEMSAEDAEKEFLRSMLNSKYNHLSNYISIVGEQPMTNLYSKKWYHIKK